MLSIVNFEGIGKNVAQFISAEAARLEESEQRTHSLHGDHTQTEALVHCLEEQLHFLTRIEDHLNSKTLHVISELNKIQGMLTAKEVNLQTAYKSLKIQDRTTGDQEHRKQLESEMKKNGEIIRKLATLITEIKAVETRIAKDAQRDMSTRRMIAAQAKRGT